MKMNIAEYKGVFVFAQQVDNKLSGIALELIGKGKDLAKDLDTEVTAVLVGHEVKDLADELAAYGADRVILVDDPELKEYRTEPYAHALSSVIEKYKPEIFLVGATAIGQRCLPCCRNQVMHIPRILWMPHTLRLPAYSLSRTLSKWFLPVLGLPR